MTITKNIGFEFFCNTTNKNFNEVFLNSFQQGIYINISKLGKTKNAESYFIKYFLTYQL